MPVPAGAEQLEGQPQEQRQEQHKGLEVDGDVELDWEVPEVPEPAHFGDDLHSPHRFLKVTSAEATAVDVIDGGGTRISRLFQAQVIWRGSGPNRVVECPIWAVVQGKAGVQPWVVSVVPFVQVRLPSTHNRLLLCSIDALGQLQRWKQCEWSDVRAIAPAPHLKEAAQAFLLRFQKQLLGRGPKGEKGGRAGSDASGDPSLQSKGRTEQQAGGSRRPRPTTTPQEVAQAEQQTAVQPGPQPMEVPMGNRDAGAKGIVRPRVIEVHFQTDEDNDVHFGGRMQSVAETAGIFTLHQSVSRRPFTVTRYTRPVFWHR